MEKGGPKILTVSAAEAGQKLVQYLGRALGPDVPGSVFMRWIRTGQVRLDGKRAKPFGRVEEGQAVRLPPFAEIKPGREAATAAARAGLSDAGQAEPGGDARPDGAGAFGLAVIAETDRWLVIAKPAGLPVHPGSGWTDSVQTRLDAAYGGSAFTPTLVHRLDRDTSGVLLAARTHRALTAAHQAIRQGQAVKEYLCWVWGGWELSAPGQSVEMADRLEKTGPPGRERMTIGKTGGKTGGKAGAEAGKAARLAATPLAIEPDRALLLVRLFTGRTHQIRAQLSSRGHPIVGDAKYGGGATVSRGTPLFLHAWRLTILGETFTCPPPWTGRWAPPGNP